MITDDLIPKTLLFWASTQMGYIFGRDGISFPPKDFR